MHTLSIIIPSLIIQFSYLKMKNKNTLSSHFLNDQTKFSFHLVLTVGIANDYSMLLCFALLACSENMITSTTRLYASTEIGFFRCCYSALKQIQSISFSLFILIGNCATTERKRENEKYSLMFIYSSFLFLSSSSSSVCSSQSFDCMHAIDNDDVDD